MKKLALKFAALLFVGVLFSLCCTITFGQTPAPSSSSVSFNVGAGAFGLGGTSNATPATDVTLDLNPGIAKMPNFTLHSDNLMWSGGQYFGGGGTYALPKLSKTGLFSQVYFTVNASFGLDRIAESTGPNQSNFSAMIGGTMHFRPSPSVDLNVLQVGWIKTPGAPWGSSAPYVGGKINYFFSKGQ